MRHRLFSPLLMSLVDLPKHGVRYSVSWKCLGYSVPFQLLHCVSWSSMVSPYCLTSSGFVFILRIRDFSLPIARPWLSGKYDLSCFHGQVTLYLPSAYRIVSLKCCHSGYFFSWCLESSGDSCMPIDSNRQKSSRSGLVGRDVSTPVNKLVSLRISVPQVITNMLCSVVFFAVSDAYTYRPGWISTFCSKIRSK